MTDETANLVLEHLKRIRVTLDDLREETRELKVRTSNVEAQVVALDHRMDPFDDRLARIERRLDLVEA